MPNLQNFPVAVQADPNSCWACAAREIINWYHRQGQANGQSYASDQALADAWAAVSHANIHADITVQQSAAAALEALGFNNNIDDHPIPTAAEITEQIEAGNPLLAIVGAAQPAGGVPDAAYQNGHWVVIVGIEAQNQGYTLHVFDPDDGAIHQVGYNAATYQPGVYWENTSYVDAYGA